MNWDDFRILYRQFLFRVVDLEVLSPQALGDANRMLGRFASLLIFAGVGYGIAILLTADPHTPRDIMLVREWPMEHAWMATTMLAVGLFAVLSWDATFPDRRDVMILSPLPVSVRTIFLAKIAAPASALFFVIVALNTLASLAWALVLTPHSTSPLDLILTPELYRTFAAWWITVSLAGAFVFGSMLCVQGLASQLLTRRLFLRVSALLQIAAFVLLLTVYLLQPSLASPQAAADPRIHWLPSYWFLSLFQQLNGSPHPALAPLAQRAWIGLAIVLCGTAAAYSLSYVRTLRKIVEEPDIAAGPNRRSWLPRFGNPLSTAVVQFGIRTLLRSRQHRLMLAFYLGAGFAITILFGGTAATRQRFSDPSGLMGFMYIASSIVLLIAWIVGTQVVFSVPLDLRANWIFRVTPLPGARVCLPARRRTILVLALAPSLLGAALLFLPVWPWQQMLEHLTLLGLFGLVLVEVALLGRQKIPFTCSWLPGKANFLTFWLPAYGLMGVIGMTARWELQALKDPIQFAAAAAFLFVAVVLARWWAMHSAGNELPEVLFEDTEPPTILTLGLYRDGSLD